MDIVTDQLALLPGDCLERMREFGDNSIDAVVTDPPYGLKFMAHKWDCTVPSVEIWREVLRVLKPGGHLLCFAGTRTQHRMCVNIEDAGFEIRDMLAWIYGSGFPKSLDISKRIDKSLGLEREFASVPVSPQAAKWSGWGTGIKPALEPITLARKPIENTIVANLLDHRVGALNLGKCAVDGMDGRSPRWPANLIHDGSEEVMALFPETMTSSRKADGVYPSDKSGHVYNKRKRNTESEIRASKGSAARFFYCPKASRADREIGLENAAAKSASEMTGRKEGSAGLNSPRAGAGRTSNGRANHHPTVKPTELMRYLVRLITPPSGWVLDPFMGSGSTGRAALLEGFNFAGIELDTDYYGIAAARIFEALTP